VRSLNKVGLEKEIFEIISWIYAHLKDLKG